MSQLIPSCAPERVVHLNPYFRVRYIFVFQRTIIWFLVGIVGYGSRIFLTELFGLESSQMSGAWRILAGLLDWLWLGGLFAWIYWHLYRRTLTFFIRGFRLVEQSGVLLIRKDSRLIGLIASVVLEQGFLDQIFDVYRLRFYMSSGNLRRKYIQIPCLSRSEALLLEDYFSDQISRLMSPAQDALRYEEKLSVQQQVEAEGH